MLGLFQYFAVLNILDSEFKRLFSDEIDLSWLCTNQIARFFKGYCRYRMITSQNVPSEAQIKNFFLFCRKNMFRSQYIQVFVFLTIPCFTKSVTSRWVFVHETRYIFEYIFWITAHETTKLGQLIDISKGNNFQ